MTEPDKKVVHIDSIPEDKETTELNQTPIIIENDDTAESTDSKDEREDANGAPEFDDNQNQTNEVSDDELSSVATEDILSVDPLYFRLNKFLTSDDGTSVANLLHEICQELKRFNNNMETHHNSFKH